MAGLAAAAVFACLVVSVADGDTLTCRDGVKVRLWGLDAPETKPRGGQPFGLEARARLGALVLDQELRCAVKGRSYDRVVAQCRLPSGRDVASVLVADGLAWAEPRYGKGHYLEEERSAACLGLGLWRGAILPPWHWRRCGDDTP